MQSGTRGIGKHVEHVELGHITVMTSVIGAFLRPFTLPFLINFAMIVLHVVKEVLNTRKISECRAGFTIFA